MEKENTPPSSHPKLSLSLKRRFAALEREEVEQCSLVKVPKRTKQSNFEQCRRDYNRRNPGSEIRRDILESMECQELDEVLSTLIVETRKENGGNILSLHFTSFSPNCIAMLCYFIRTWTYLSFLVASLPLAVY